MDSIRTNSGSSPVPRLPWIERKFTFDIPPGWMPNILERLRGTSVRIERLVQGLNEQQLTQPCAGTWCVKDHIGHLSDLEALHDGRIDDFQARKPILRAADMSNAQTNLANHSLKSVVFLVQEFDKLRNHFVDRLATLDQETMDFVSMHPRLQQPMRPVDLAFFTAEHDDHHLATISLIRSILLK